MFNTPPPAHHHPPEPPRQKKDRQAVIDALDFSLEVLRRSHIILVCLGVMKFIGLGAVAGYIVSLGGGPADFDVKQLAFTLLCMLPITFVGNIIRFGLDDEEE